MDEINEILLKYYDETDPALDPYQRASYCIKAAIANDLLKAGDPVPSTSALAELFKINPMTASKALQDVHRTGIILKERGKAYMVVDGSAENARDQMERSLMGQTILYLSKTMEHFGIENETIMKWLKEAGAK